MSCRDIRQIADGVALKIAGALRDPDIQDDAIRWTRIRGMITDGLRLHQVEVEAQIRTVEQEGARKALADHIRQTRGATKKLTTEERIELAALREKWLAQEAEMAKLEGQLTYAKLHGQRQGRYIKELRTFIRSLGVDPPESIEAAYNRDRKERRKHKEGRHAEQIRTGHHTPAPRGSDVARGQHDENVPGAFRGDGGQGARVRDLRLKYEVEREWARRHQVPMPDADIFLAPGGRGRDEPADRGYQRTDPAP